MRTKASHFAVARKTDGVLGEILHQGLSLDEAESYTSADDTLVILAVEPAIDRV
ncbi:MAG: hypothetical protein IID44_05120 [Planctomycetes bacterium]|nr:hypothetical protein [Planctomycetota bacterium]